MSPFASLLYSYRMHRGVRQSELADLIGYEQTYISALEIGKKGPPTPDFISRLIIALDLSVDERNRLLEAVDASQRKFIIDNDMPPEVFWLFRDLRDVNQRAILSRLGVETASNSFHLSMSPSSVLAGGFWSDLYGHDLRNTQALFSTKANNY